MKIVFPISALIACVIFFFYLPIFAAYCDTIDMDLEQYKLDKSVEFSTRAAALNGLQHGLVTFDRSEFQEVEFNTAVVLDTYAQFMCFNYNMLPTEGNKELMLNRSALMVVGGRGFSVTQSEYGDYYIAGDGSISRVKGSENPMNSPYKVVSNTGARTIFGVYTPFSVAIGKNAEGFDQYVNGSLLPNAKSYALFMKNDATSIAGVSTISSLPYGVTTARIQHEALAMMSRAFTQAWYQLSSKNATNQRLTLPDTLTNLGISSAANPGVMVLVEGFNITTSRLLRSEAFTGYKAVVRREVVAYTQTINGVVSHWYCYRDQLDMDKALAGGYGNIEIDYVYSDMQEAAKAEIVGCSYHNNEHKYTCPDAQGNPTAPHCHYQPNVALIVK